MRHRSQPTVSMIGVPNATCFHLAHILSSTGVHVRIPKHRVEEFTSTNAVIVRAAFRVHFVTEVHVCVRTRSQITKDVAEPTNDHELRFRGDKYKDEEDAESFE